MATPGRVFVTGVHGFIGRALVERFRAVGAEVSGVDVLPGADSAIVQGDVAQPGDWQARMAGSDLVVHTAAIVGFYSSPQGY